MKDEKKAEQEYLKKLEKEQKKRDEKDRRDFEKHADKLIWEQIKESRGE